ncbi:putative phosphatidate phosphatase [Stomoxys calcitrans]|uniref:putative phosphatidate phosphatase n=1 Tax=Stomoxys calcitrans TaxID=35570 RepID=UPI0027E39719|nr:putative phosphatidate phosphatase [Stomoxys calcitrans]
MIRTLLSYFLGFGIFSSILFLGFNMDKVMGPAQRRGFLCGDVSLRQPYVADTIGYMSLYMVGVAIPLAIIILNELMQHLWVRKQKNKAHNGFISQLFSVVKPFFYGFATERFLKSTTKFIVARLRPHFYTACQPITQDGVFCDDKTEENFFVLDYKCTEEVSDTTFTSFPSGHSSLAFYGLVYAAIYLEKFARRSREGECRFISAIYGPLVPVLQLLCLMLATSVAISRVFDFKHFWSDIFAGSLLGIVTAVMFSVQRKRDLFTDDMMGGTQEDSSC